MEENSETTWIGGKHAGCVVENDTNYEATIVANKKSYSLCFSFNEYDDKDTAKQAADVFRIELSLILHTTKNKYRQIIDGDDIYYEMQSSGEFFFL